MGNASTAPKAPKATARRRREKGTGSVYEARPGFWRGSLPYTDPATGERKERWTSGPTRAAVNNKLLALRDERDRGAPVARTPTMGEWADRWLRTTRHQVRPSTFSSYQWALAPATDAKSVRNLRARLGDIRLGNLRPSQVEEAVAGMIDDGMKPSTAMLARRVLGGCLAAAVRDGLIVRNAAAESRPPRLPATERRSLSPVELRRLLDVAATDNLIGAAIEVLAATGMRRGELLGLRWSDWDREAGTITIRRALVRGVDGPALSEPKTATSRRVIALPSLAQAALERRREQQEGEMASEYWSGGSDPLVFADEVGRRIHPVAFGSAFRRMAGRAGLEGVTPHVMRHSAASLLLAAGVPPRDVAESLGHSTRVLLRTYAHALPDSKSRVAAAMDEVLQ